VTNAIQRELMLPQPPERVWESITDPAMLAEWMFPNDFAPHVGHRFTFSVPANPAVKFDGLTVRCEVLECDPPRRLVFSWSAGGAVENTLVTFNLLPDDGGTRLTFQHSGFDLSEAFGPQAFKGAEYGWTRMLKQLCEIVARRATAGKVN